MRTYTASKDRSRPIFRQVRNQSRHKFQTDKHCSRSRVTRRSRHYWLSHIVGFFDLHRLRMFFVPNEFSSMSVAFLRVPDIHLSSFPAFEYSSSWHFHSIEPNCFRGIYEFFLAVVRTIMEAYIFDQLYSNWRMCLSRRRSSMLSINNIAFSAMLHHLEGFGGVISLVSHTTENPCELECRVLTWLQT